MNNIYCLKELEWKPSNDMASKFSTANIYDSTFEHCKPTMRAIKEYNPFILLGDAAYDSTKLFNFDYYVAI